MGFPGIIYPARNGEITLSAASYVSHEPHMPLKGDIPNGMFAVARIMQVGICISSVKNSMMDQGGSLTTNTKPRMTETKNAHPMEVSRSRFGQCNRAHMVVGKENRALLQVRVQQQLRTTRRTTSLERQGILSSSSYGCQALAFSQL